MTIPQILSACLIRILWSAYFSAASRNCSSSKPNLVHLCTTIVPSKRNHMSIAPSTSPPFLGSETRPNRRVTEPWTETYPERELEPSTSWTRKQRVVPQEGLPVYLGGPAKMSLWRCVPRRMSRRHFPRHFRTLHMFISRVPPPCFTQRVI